VPPEPGGGWGRLAPAAAKLPHGESGGLTEAPLHVGVLRFHRAAVSGLDEAEAALVLADLQMRGLEEELRQRASLAPGASWIPCACRIPSSACASTRAKGYASARSSRPRRAKPTPAHPLPCPRPRARIGPVARATILVMLGG
jgi:hypothetical protein